WLILDRPDEASRQLGAAEQTLAPGFHLPHVLAVQAATNLDLYRGDARTARARLDDAWPQIDRIGALRIHHLRVQMLALRARVQLAAGGDPKHALTTSAELLREGATWASGLGHLLAAAARAAQRDEDAALAELASAEQDLVASQMIGFLHLARWRR